MYIESMRTMPSGLAAHNRGDDNARPTTAVPRDEYDRDAARDLGADPDRAQQIVSEAAAKRAGKPGRPPHMWVSIVTGGPPPFEALDRWAPARVLAYMRDTHEFIVRISGGRPLLNSSVHLDERSPHGHHTAPAPDGYEAWLDAASLEGAKMLADEGTEDQLEQPRHGDRLTVIHDAYQQEVADKYGVERGFRGQGRQHREPDRMRGAKERIEDEQRLRREAQHLASTATTAASEAGARADGAARQAREAEEREQTEREGRQRAESDAAATLKRSRELEGQQRRALELVATEGQARVDAEKERDIARQQARDAKAATEEARLQAGMEYRNRERTEDALTTETLARIEAEARAESAKRKAADAARQARALAHHDSRAAREQMRRELMPDRRRAPSAPARTTGPERGWSRGQ